LGGAIAGHTPCDEGAEKNEKTDGDRGGRSGRYRLGGVIFYGGKGLDRHGLPDGGWFDSTLAL
jgi:hypothetical protein